jgi:hypothetical protein
MKNLLILANNKNNEYNKKQRSQQKTILNLLIKKYGVGGDPQFGSGDLTQKEISDRYQF